MGKIIELDDERELIELHYRGQRIGSFWDHPDGLTVKINPEFWLAPWKISEGESYHDSTQFCIILYPKQ